MSLTILVRKAINLQNRESVGKSDPYVLLHLQGEKKKTSVKDDTLEPVWDEEVVYSFGDKPPRTDELIYVSIKDKNTIGWNKLMGKTTIPLRNITQGRGTLELEQTLIDENDRQTSGRLYLSCTYEAPKEEIKRETKTPPGSSISKVNDSNNNSNALLAGSTVHIPKQDSLPMTKTMFQIRIRVIEARQLMGSDLNTRCSVKFRSELQQTTITKGTHAPWFDQHFYFQCELMPDDFMNSILVFRVCNCHTLRSEAIIGEFKCEVRKIYDNEKHAILNKWLVLAHPEEMTPTVQGYLKVSAAVIIPGSEIPDMSINNKETDVEENLLWTIGVHLQPAYFILSIFLAEDLPRMDSGAMQTLKEAFGFGKASKELTDPYVIVSFAGREIQSRIMYHNCDPEFRQEIYLGFLFPSMCDTLSIRLMDWDRVGDDDEIGSTSLAISNISDSSGKDGYLPTFGPGFINLYGKRREWELIDSTKNADENCAYRGRILFSLKTVVGSYPPKTMGVMDNFTFDSCKKYRSTKDYFVVAHLTHVSMLREANKPMEIEVSMGNFGNKLENSVMPSPSTTHPTNPIFDGCKYYYLPWVESEPFIVVSCQWEDVAYRLEYSNLIRNIVQDLKTQFENIKTIYKNRNTKLSNMPEILNIIDRISIILRNKTPSLDHVSYKLTSLDQSLMKQRKNVINKLLSLSENAELLDYKNVEEIIESQIFKLKSLIEEPQNSFPNIFIWLLNGTRRVAFARIPAQQIIYSEEIMCQGANCGKYRAFNLQFSEDDSIDLAGTVSGSLWFGKEEEYKNWWKNRPDLQLTVFAETYENQIISSPGSGKWKSESKFLRRPAFSDADGLQELSMESFECSEGWKFQEDWIVDPEVSSQFESDAGHTVYCEEVYHQQVRVPGGSWMDAPTPWTDVVGDPSIPRKDVICPDGWQWKDAWAVDLQRAVDADGWEYTVQKGLSGWSPQEKMYHIIRRRRWVRERQRHQLEHGKVQKSNDGWEYSSLFSNRFHMTERKIDVVRRRRWRRKLMPIDSSIVNFPKISILRKEQEISAIVCPRQYVISTERNAYQLRAHIYQARNLLPGDKTGLSDPYCVINFCGSTQQTEREYQTLCPTWDQTLIFNEITLSGKLFLPNSLISPPHVNIEVFDWDYRGTPEFLGRLSVIPERKSSSDFKASKLKWYILKKDDYIQGEILSSFDLILRNTTETPILPPMKGDLYMVPFGVRPVLQKTRIEVLCWGIRNMKSFEYQSISHPSVEFECSGKIISSTVIQNYRASPNFSNPFLCMDVELPKEGEFMPPLILIVYDNRAFGSKPMVASAQINNLWEMSQSVNILRPPSVLGTTLQRKQSNQEGTNGHVCREPTIDWWSKYYASLGNMEQTGAYLEKGYETLEIFTNGLENDSRFKNFKDMTETICLSRGHSENRVSVGEFKGKFCVYPINKETQSRKILSHHPSTEPQLYNVRVYAISAENLTPKDDGGTSDPYIKIKFGKTELTSKDNVKRSTLNPIFGEVFELKALVPQHKDLKIQLWDSDKFSSDDFIGETVIDIENRVLTKQRAIIGLPRQYHTSGINAWRDYQVPSLILSETCKNLGIPEPIWNDSKPCLVLDGTNYSLSDFESDQCILPSSVGNEKERLSLYVLHEKFTMVPEHVEKRNLYNPDMPGLSQGVANLWVDIFPDSVPLPPGTDISPRKPVNYVLRISIYNCHDCALQEKNIAGEAMSDVYIKGFMCGSSNVQSTDVHYRCMDGDANFNWRFVIPFEYLEAEQMVVTPKKDGIFSSIKDKKMPPKLKLQILDNDIFLSDDCLGEITLNLTKIAKPARTAKKANLSVIPYQNGFNHMGPETGSVTSDEMEYVNLFESKRIYGFFPLVSYSKDCEVSIGGKLEAEIEVLTQAEAEKRPAGQGRDEPNANPHLPEPNRPSTSFLWLTSPLKSFRFVLWKNYKWYIITFVVLLILFIFILLFLYSLPGATMDYLIGVD